MRSIVLVTLLAACSGSPTPTGTVCPDPDPGDLTYDGADGFGKKFMDDYCIMCHSSTLPHAQRNGAPLYHDYDTLIGVLRTADHIDEQAGFGPKAQNTFMAPDQCPSTPGGPLAVSCKQPTDEERTKLSMWLACERNRPHTF